MSIFDALILGIVEGITEFLPISSTAHLMIASRLLNLQQSEFVKSFEIVIQFGAIAAVLFVFGSKLIKNFQVWKKILIAFIPTAIIGFLLYKTIKDVLIGNLSIAAYSLIIGGLILILIELFYKKQAGNGQLNLNEQTSTEENIDEMSKISNKQAFVIGLVQSIAIVPGVSRSAATIVPALLFGFGRKAAAEFSFLLAIPTIAAAAGYDAIKNFETLSGNAMILIVGFIASFIAAMVSIKLLMSFIQKNSFTSFGIYRVIIGIVILMFFI